MKPSLLINEPPLTVSPTLATILGLDEAIVVQQVHYWLSNQKNAGREENGEKWVYNTYEEWQEGNFPFWSADKIQRLFLKLENQGIIISAQLDAKKRDMKKFYRLDYDAICAMHGAVLRPSNTAKLHDVKDESETNAETNRKPPKIKGIEAAMFADRKVTKDDFPQALEDEALKAFEAAMHCPGSWKWYPGKASDEKAWKELREAVVSIYQSDGAEAFAGYYSWSVQPYSRGAMTLLAIQGNPAGFPLSWVAYQGSDAYRGKKTDETRAVYVDDKGIPLT